MQRFPVKKALKMYYIRPTPALSLRAEYTRSIRRLVVAPETVFLIEKLFETLFFLLEFDLSIVLFKLRYVFSDKINHCSIHGAPIKSGNITKATQ